MTTKILRKLSQAAQRQAREAARNKLRTGESKPDSTGTASKTRLNLGKLGAKTKGQAKSLEEKMVALENLDDKKGEPAQLLRNAIRGIKSNLPASVIKQVQSKVKKKTTKSDQQLMDDYKKKLVADGKHTQAEINKMDEAGMFNKGGKATKKVPVISIGVGMAEMKKGKAKMMRGGMANKKEHMYVGGGSVTDNLTPAQKNMVRKMAEANKR